MSADYAAIESKMEKTISFLSEELATIRAGRANAAVLDKVLVDYYGTPTPIGQIASISVPEPKMLIVQPWDGGILKEVEKAILKSDLGIAPANDGKVLRLIFPALTEERRRELVKGIQKKGEEAKIAVRSVRRDAIDLYKAQEKKGEVTEDDLRRIEKEIQNITDDFTKKIDEVIKRKEKEIMEI